MNPEGQQRAEFPGIEAADPVARLPARVAEADDGKAIIEKDEHGNPMFKVSKINECLDCLLPSISGTNCRIDQQSVIFCLYSFWGRR